MSSAVERALVELDAAAIETAFREQDEFALIEHFLPRSALSPLLHDVDLKDAFAYFGVRTLWQSRARSRHGRLAA
jgi:hypothetical protein